MAKKCKDDLELKKNILNDKLDNFLFNTKDNLWLDLDVQNFDNQCIFIDEILNENNLFLRVYEFKDKFFYLIKQNSQKNTVLRDLSSCIIEKFNGFHIDRTDQEKKWEKVFNQLT